MERSIQGIYRGRTEAERREEGWKQKEGGEWSGNRRPNEERSGRSGKEKNIGGPKRKWMAPAACVLGSMILYGALVLTGEEQGLLSADGRILRDGYGGDTREYQMLVDGLEEEPVAVTVTVGARTYTEEEAEEAFWEIMESMEQRIRAGNPSLMEVREDLHLMSRTEDGVRLRWYSSDSEIMDASGKLRKEVSEETGLILSVQLSAGSFRQDYEIPIRILPAERTKEEQKLADFLGELRQQEEQQQKQPWFTLPESFEGKELQYRLKEESGYGSIILIGLILAVLLVAREHSEEKQKNQKRERELLLDYADVLSKVMVLTGAGLTIRNAWERIVLDYETARKQGKQKPRAAYEEMRQTYYQMLSGMAEGEAYREFGRRCRLQPYLKLSGLLEQNRKTGTKNMRSILQTEMSDALEQRKNLARRLGEEAGTRLLMPLFLMLGIVMVMIMVPAMMTMG